MLPILSGLSCSVLYKIHKKEVANLLKDLKHKVDYVLNKFLIVVETLISIFAVGVLVALLVVECYSILADPSFFFAEDAVTQFLHNMLTIVIGLEFVKLLMHLTPANILEVLTMAIARSIIVDHGSAVDNLLSIACIIGMFAARRYLIPRTELYRDLDDESSPNSQGHRRYNRHHDKKDARKEEPAQKN